jgi:hypothetical protein
VVEGDSDTASIGGSDLVNVEQLVRGIARVPAVIWQRIRLWLQQGLSAKVKGFVIGVLVTFVVVIPPWWCSSSCHHSLNPIVQGGIIGALITLVIGMITWRWISQWFHNLALGLRNTLIGGLILLIGALAQGLIGAPGIGQAGQALVCGCIGGFAVLTIMLLFLPRPTPSSEAQHVIGASIGISVVLIVMLLFFPFFDTRIAWIKPQCITITPTPTLTPTPMQTPTSPPMPTATVTDTPTHTATPMPSKKVVEAFLVTKWNSPLMVEPGTTITATVQEIVQIKVKVSTTYEEQEEDLIFTWYTCWAGSRPVVQRVGNSEVLYIAPREPGTDCIVVVVEKGGVLLARENIFVDVQK